MLDSTLNGGFPAGSLITVTGPPGSGKTVFAANWIYNGIEKHGLNGVYMSFIEGYKSFIKNMHGLGLDFEKLENTGKFRFMEMATLREVSVPTVFEQILQEVYNVKASMLVIDSFSAISQVMEKPYDPRILIHTVLGKIVREVDCTTMLIIEKTSVEETYESAEFLSDFIIHLSKVEVDGVHLRTLKIVKARGTEIQQPQVAFTLKGGFKAFQPLNVKLLESIKKFKIVPHGKDYYSSGIQDLDNMLGVMFKCGSYNLLEVETDVTLPPEHLLRVTISNALNQGTCVVILPHQGLSAPTVWKSLEPLVYEDALKDNLKVVDFKVVGEAVEITEPYVILFEGRSLRKDMVNLWDTISELRNKSGKPVLTVVGFDTLEYVYGLNEILKVLGEDLAKTRKLGDVRLNIVRPECAIAAHLRSLANTHMVVRERYGAVFLQGKKPKTPLLNIELHTNEESEVKLIPVL